MNRRAQNPVWVDQNQQRTPSRAVCRHRSPLPRSPRPPRSDRLRRTPPARGKRVVLAHGPRAPPPQFTAPGAPPLCFGSSDMSGSRTVAAPEAGSSRLCGRGRAHALEGLPTRRTRPSRRRPCPISPDGPPPPMWDTAPLWVGDDPAFFRHIEKTEQLVRIASSAREDVEPAIRRVAPRTKMSVFSSM